MLLAWLGFDKLGFDKLFDIYFYFLKHFYQSRVKGLTYCQNAFLLELFPFVKIREDCSNSQEIVQTSHYSMDAKHGGKRNWKKYPFPARMPP